MNNAVSLEGLVKRYGKHRGIEGLDLKVKEGEWFGYIGPNGAGKSTTIRTMLGLIKATEGKITVLGMDSWKEREKIMEKVGYLPSEAIFYPEMTVSETLDYALSLHACKDRRRQKELSERLELDTGRKIGELSYGNRKKVGIVCALEHNPSLLILDEPTGGLDPLMQREFFSMLEEAAEDTEALSDVPISIWIDKEAMLPVKYEMDMTEMMQSLMAQVSAAVSMEYPTVSGMKISMTIGGIDTVEAITIPDEARNAESLS